MQREIDQRRGDRRDHQRQQQDVDARSAASPARSGSSSITISTKSPPIGAGPTTRMTSLSAQRTASRRRPTMASQPRHVAHVDVVMDRRRHVGDGEQAALVAHLHRDRLRADAVEHLPRQAVRHRCRSAPALQHQRGGVRGGEPVVQPVQPEIGDRRHVDQHFRDHHEQDREDEELARQAEARRARARLVVRRCGRRQRVIASSLYVAYSLSRTGAASR